MGGNLLWHFSGTNNQPLLVQKLIITTVLHDIHACMHACIRTYTHTHIHTHAHIHTYTHTHIHTYTHTHTYLLRTVIANFDVECILRAKTPTVNWHEEWKIIRIHIYIYILYLYLYNTYNHSRRWSYKATAINYMSPPAATYMRPGAGL